MATKQFKLTDAVENVKFQIDDDEFEAIAPNRLPAGALAKYFEQNNEGKLFEAHNEFFKTVLLEQSYKLFEDRLNSVEKPITLKLIADISTWLLGEIYMGGKASESASSSGATQ